jgi:hypothetical protein
MDLPPRRFHRIRPAGRLGNPFKQAVPWRKNMEKYHGEAEISAETLGISRSF